MAEERLENRSIYRACRSIKRRDNSLYNALRSIYEDSIFVLEIAGLWPDLPLLANLRCGLWYSPRFDSTCYFKSTDGHANNCSFSTARLNLHVAQFAGQKGGCIIIDSTRRGKRFPDSMSKTIPIWACVLNRAIKNHRQKMFKNDTRKELESESSLTLDWDCSLHLPLWVPETEKAAIEDRLEEWTKQLEATGADISCLTLSLAKPLRPLWISQKTIIWLNEVPNHDCWDFTPIILVSASSSDGMTQQRSTSEFSWHYISGAGDDEESWARGLSPKVFWSHAHDLIKMGPGLCNQRVADIVEKDRVYRAQRGEITPQVMLDPRKLSARNRGVSHEESSITCPLNFEKSQDQIDLRSLGENCSIHWIGLTKLAVGSTQHVSNVFKDIDCILNCDSELVSACFPTTDAYLHLPIVTSKFDRFSVFNNLPSALKYARLNLSKGKKILVCCENGEDISVCVCLAILTSVFDDGGRFFTHQERDRFSVTTHKLGQTGQASLGTRSIVCWISHNDDGSFGRSLVTSSANSRNNGWICAGCFDDGKTFNETCITKWEMRRRLVFICKFAVNARPSRGNLKQVFSFLSQR